MTIPDQLRALASFVEEHDLTDDDIYSAEINYDDGRLHWNRIIAQLRKVLSFMKGFDASKMPDWSGSELVDLEGLLEEIYEAAVTRPDEVAP
tara:strand:- start:43 stop:318 length:276 start_codon:yes stop_codon:yes gene_type:complete